MDHGSRALTDRAPPPPRDRGDTDAAPAAPPITRREFLALALPAALSACGAAPASDSGGNGRTERARVVVIGAGLAGLAAAEALARAGVEVRVLEARDRPGGRVHTLRAPFDNGLYAEAGAVFVPGDHATTLRYVRELGLPLREAAAGGRGAGERVCVGGASVRVEAGQRPRWPVALKPREQGLTPGELRSLYLGPVVDSIGDPEHPLWPGQAALRLDGVTLAQLLAARGASPGAVALMRLGYLDEWGDGIEHVSALSLLREVALNRGTGAMRRIAGGTDRLPLALAAWLGPAVRYGAAATALERGRSGVRVAYTAGGEARAVVAERVICAIPFTVLRRLRVDPPFAVPKRTAVQRLAATSVTRVYLQFRGPVWDPADGDAVATDLPMMLAAHASAGQTGGGTLLEAFVTGAEARALARMPAEACIRRVAAQMARVVPATAGRVERGAVFSWDADPWARGDYAWFRPGDMRALAPHLATPEGRIHFAGDHTSARPGWMQGALDSGLRAAEEVMDASAGGRAAGAARSPRI